MLLELRLGAEGGLQGWWLLGAVETRPSSWLARGDASGGVPPLVSDLLRAFWGCRAELSCYKAPQVQQVRKLRAKDGSSSRRMCPVRGCS